MAGANKMITLKTSDGEDFEVEEVVAMESQTIRHIIEDEYANNGILLPIINSKILSKVMQYCKMRIQAKPTIDTTARASGAYEAMAPAGPVKDLNEATLFDLAVAANYLNIKGLPDLTSEALADMINGNN